MKYIKTITVFILLVLSASAYSATLPARAISFGPMWHWNFGGDEMKFSWAFEASYWQTYGNPKIGEPHLHGIDAGIEFQGKARRIYGEYQNGFIFLGGSVGPVIEISEGKYNYGIQSGMWGSLFVGLDIRMRYVVENGLTFAPGVFLKLPIDLNNGDYGIHGN